MFKQTVYDLFSIFEICRTFSGVQLKIIIKFVYTLDFSSYCQNLYEISQTVFELFSLLARNYI